MSDYGKLDELLGEYWNAAYKEGVEGRYHDTVDSEAQRTLNSIHAELEKQLAERDAALARCVEALYEHVIVLCEGEKVDYEATQSPEDRSYNLAIDHVVERIRIDQRDAFPSFASAQATEKVLAECRWKNDDGYDLWNTECGELFVLEDGTPKKNGMVFCPYCGKAIREEQDGK